ncbi:MAG: phosphatidylglycerophosphatase A [Elusimicrobia bacterium]|nr:phosphatidylglycerophosphatase A [Elusimicrobiota bacterium]
MKRWGVLAAAGLGIGYLPGLPATYASAAAAALYAVPLPFAARAGLTAALIALGFWSSGIGVEHFRVKDPRPVVIDEIAAQYLALLIQEPRSWTGILVGFCVFRCLDGLKPFGLRRLEALPGGLGVMADDLGAALLGGLALHAAVALGLAM